MLLRKLGPGGDAADGGERRLVWKPLADVSEGGVGLRT